MLTKPSQGRCQSPLMSHPAQRPCCPNCCAGVVYESRNVLADPDLREAIKKYSSWPTIPQVRSNIRTRVCLVKRSPGDFQSADVGNSGACTWQRSTSRYLAARPAAGRGLSGCDCGLGIVAYVLWPVF